MTIRTKKTKKFAALAVVFVLIGIGTALIIIIRHHNHIDSPKLYSLIDRNSTCSQSMPALNDIKPNTSQPKESILLFSYEESCYARAQQYQKVLATAELRYAYDMKIHDQTDAQSAEADVNYYKQLVANVNKPATGSDHSDQITPAFAAQLKAQAQEQQQ